MHMYTCQIKRGFRSSDSRTATYLLHSHRICLTLSSDEPSQEVLVSDDAAFGTIYPSRLAKLRGGLNRKEWLTIGGMTLTIIALNVIGWGLVSAASTHHYHISKTGFLGLGTGVLAYTLGMRHAFDADHIAAIDNTTRKLVNDGKRPLSVGYFFSLGHSTIVFLLAVLLELRDPGAR